MDSPSGRSLGLLCDRILLAVQGLRLVEIIERLYFSCIISCVYHIILDENHSEIILLQRLVARK